MKAEVISKATGALTNVSADTIDLNAPSIVRLDIARADIAAFERQGDTLIVRLANGEQIRIVDFYAAPGATPNDLVLRDGDGTLWQARVAPGTPHFTAIDDLDALAAAGAGGGGSSLSLPLILGGLVAAGGAAALAAGGGGGGGTAVPATGGGAMPDRDPPAVPTATVRGDGLAVAGRGEAGATVAVRDAAGAVIGTGTVAADGSYVVTVAQPQTNGERLTVTQADAGGNVSPAASAVAPDLTAPGAPTAVVDAAGTTVTGTGEAGATVTVRGAAGAVIGTAVVAANGSYVVTVAQPQANGERLTVTQADPAGNVSTPTTLSAPDVTAPAAPSAMVNGGGTLVSGTGEAGGRVTVVDAGGAVVGSATVGADGSFSAPLQPVQANGGTLTVTQTDPAGNVSTGVTVAAPDVTAPAQPTAAINGDGTIVSGTGEPGARITITGVTGSVIGTATVAATGAYSAALTPAQANGEALTVGQADAAGNAAPPLPLIAPDITAPAAPVAALDATGTTVSGTGEPGAQVAVRDGAGTVLGTAIVGAGGSYAVVLAAAQIDRQPLSVVQTDAAGNASAAVPLTAPDLTAPAAPIATVAADGTSISGSGEAGATVTVRDPFGVAIGNAVVGANGSFTVTLAPAQVDGQVLAVTQADTAGNVSPAAAATAPDLVVDTDPAAPTASVGADGAAVTGTALAGATITVTDATGTVIGTGVADAAGSYTVALSPPRIDGETVRVTQTEADGDISPPATAVAPDLTAPPAPTAALDPTGRVVTGTGEPGATVSVTGPGGVTIGSAVVIADGSYTVVLAPAQANGEALSVVQTDAAGNGSPSVGLTAPDLTAPAAPTAIVTGDGTVVTGTGEPGATVTITSPSGAAIGTALVAADGSYAATLTIAQVNGERLGATQADAAGNASGSTVAVAPDLTAPLAPVATINGDGTVVTGTGEPGARISVTDAAGLVIGTALVAADGSYAATLTSAQANGESLSVVQADPPGNVSPALSLTAPDITAPLAPPATLDPTGTVVTGTGEPGARVTVADSGGAVLGTATVGAGGGYTIVLSPAQIDSQALSVVQTDAAGNPSPATALTAPDLTAPVAPTAAVAGDGATLTGTGEAGATITVRDPLGQAIGTTTVAADGSYAVVLVPAQVDGERLSVVQADRAGNVSPPVAALAPDLVVDTDPAAPTAAVEPNGAAVTGMAIAGATITVYDATGTVIGTGTADAGGVYSIALSPPRIDGETVRVTQTEADGDVSPPATAVAPDLTAPAAPVAALDGTGTVVTGTGEPGATVTVSAADGTPLGTATVTAGGAYAVTLASAQVNGEALVVTQADAAGNVSVPTGLVAADITAPVAPLATVGPDGGTIAGTGEPGATVIVRDQAGAVIGTAVAAADGAFSVTLVPPQANGETVSVTLTDAAGNVSVPTLAEAPDITAPGAPTAVLADGGGTITGVGEPGATVSIVVGGIPTTSAVVAADGSYTATVTPPLANGEAVTVSQADAAGNVSPTVALTAPDTTIPDVPTASVVNGGTQVVGTGEPGATVTIAGPDGAAIGTAVVGIDGGYTAILSSPQTNGEALVATQADAAGNVSAPATAIAPDTTAPPPPTGLAVTDDGTAVSGRGEAGAQVAVRGADGTIVGTGLVTPDGSFTVALTPTQQPGATLTVTQADAAGNVSFPGTTAVAIDIDAFDNVASANVNLLPATAPVSLGSAGYLALVSLGVVNLQAQVLAVPAVQFTVQAGHSLDAVFTYDAVVNLGVASGYSVVLQRLEGTQWVAVEGGGNASLLQVGLFGNDLQATETLDPGTYRAFLTFDGALGAGVLGSLAVTGLDSDFTSIGGAVPVATQGNVVTDAGPGGEVDIVGPGTHVDSVTVNGANVAVVANGTVVDGAWGTLVIDLDGHYTYTPDADAAAIGRTDVFTYTLLDPTDGERESATLSITIGSGAVTGAPLAADDQAIASVAYQNVVETIAPAVEFSFATPGTVLVPQTGRGSDSFTVAADSTADVTITAIRGGTLALLPTYQLSVTDAGGAVVATLSQVALAGLPLGSGATFTLQDLPAGTYNYSVSSTNVAGTPYGTTVYVGETVTFLDRFTVSGTTAAGGNILDNDTANTPFAAIRVDTGGGFAEIGDTPVTLTGLHGTLTLDETGGYTYQPSATLGYSAVDLVDRFTYELVQPGGAISTATLAVTIDVPADGPATAAPALLSVVDHDVVPLDALVAHGTEALAAPTATVTGIAAYDLFEGQGELENVLGHYLATQSDGGTMIEPSTHAAASIDVVDSQMADPLDYLVTLDDRHEHLTNANHVV